MDLDALAPGDRLELRDGSVVRVVQHTPDGEHLPIVYEVSRSRVFSAGEQNLIYAHEIAGRVGEPGAESRFAYPEGEEPMYRDEHGNLLTPEEFRTLIKREETDEEREARYRHARETQRRLLGDDAPPSAYETREDSAQDSPGSA